MSDSCIVDFSNRHIFYADKLVDIRKQCWIVLEALINAKLQNRNLTYEQMDQLLWDDTLGLDLSKKQAIQDCIRDLRVAIGDTLIENCRGLILNIIVRALKRCVISATKSSYVLTKLFVQWK